MNKNLQNSITQYINSTLEDGKIYILSQSIVFSYTSPRESLFFITIYPIKYTI